jgi:hypothetical protein
MPVTASRLFDFLEEQPSCTIERYEIASAAFSDLRRSLRSIIVAFSQSDDRYATEISDRLRSILSEWLTVPVRFDDAVLVGLKDMGLPTAVQLRWGRDIRNHYEDACRAANELLLVENPVRAKLTDLLQELREKRRSFRIFCHRRSLDHFESLCTASGCQPLGENAFMHSVAQYREAEPFDVLLKVGPLRSRGWGSAPDALLTAPRFETLIQVVWSGCGDEPGFGYDPICAPFPEGGSTTDSGAVRELYSPSLRLKWKVHEIRSRDNTVGRYENLPDVNEFEVFTRLTQPADVQRATLVQVDAGYGVLYPPHSRVLGLDPGPHTIEYRLPGETLLEGMFLIVPVMDDARLAGLQAEDGQFSPIWKERLNAEYQRDPAALENRLWDTGLELLHLRGRIEHWCKPATTVIQVRVLQASLDG